MKIDSHRQFQPTNSKVHDILVEYGLTLQDYQLATTGIENITIIANCNEGKYVLRLYRQNKKTDEYIEQEWSFVDFLHENGFPVAQLVTNKDGEVLTKYTDSGISWQVILMKFVDGRHPSTYSPQLIANLASNQAKIHLLAPTYNDSYYGSILRNLREKYFIKQIDFTNLPSKEFGDLLKRAQDYEVNLSSEFEFGLCHLDFDADNVLVDEHDNLTAILDFDDLALAPFVLDLAYTLWDVYHDGGEEKVNQYLTEYQSIRPLSTEERSVLKPIILFRHYVISAIRTLAAEIDQTTATKYLAIEKSLANGGAFGSDS